MRFLIHIILLFLTFDSFSQLNESTGSDFVRTQIGINASFDVGYRHLKSNDNSKIGEFIIDYRNNESSCQVRTNNIEEHYGFTNPHNKYHSKKDIDDSTSSINKNIRLHGVFLEVFGKELLYSIGYEHQQIYRKHSFGWGVGTSMLRNKVPDYPIGFIKFNQFSLSGHVFYEYGQNWGVRTGLNINGKVNPIMFSGELNHIQYSDKPPIYLLLPSNEIGVFYRTKDNKFHFRLNASLMYIYSRYEEREAFRIQPWFGISIKYNFKIK